MQLKMDKKPVFDQIERIQAYLKMKVAAAEGVTVPPFTIYFDPDDPAASLAMPDVRSCEAVDTAVLQNVHAAFSQRSLPPRVQYLDAYNPTLAAALRHAGYTQVEEAPVMIATPDTLRPAPQMPGLTTLILSGDSSLADVQEGLRQTSELGFDPFAARILHTDPDQFRRSFITGRAFILRLNREPVTAGMFTEILDGLTEIAGITTVTTQRGRGFGAYLTGYMAQYAFSRHVDAVFLLAVPIGTESIYRRVGFKPCATLLTFELSQ